MFAHLISFPKLALLSLTYGIQSFNVVVVEEENDKEP